MPNPKAQDIALNLLGTAYAELDHSAQKVTRHVAARTPIVRHVRADASTRPSAGQAAADAVASFGGSWTFVGLFAAATLGWIGINAVLVSMNGRSFDPYPFILLNLFLSMLTAAQAPIILMSQNRQAEKDRQAAAHDYEVNLKAELEIMLLHDKLDALRDKQWNELLRIQERQIELLLAMNPSSTEKT